MSGTLAAVTRTEPSALEVLKAGQCSPACLLSQEAGRCNCRCGGTWHGALMGSLLQQAEATAT